jgi:hypothetical protein
MVINLVFFVGTACKWEFARVAGKAINVILGELKNRVDYPVGRRF